MTPACAEATTAFDARQAKYTFQPTNMAASASGQHRLDIEAGVEQLVVNAAPVEVDWSWPSGLATTDPTSNMHNIHRHLPHQRRSRDQRVGSRVVRNAVDQSGRS